MKNYTIFNDSFVNEKENVICIDAWEDDADEGVVIAKIDLITHEIKWIDMDAIADPKVIHFVSNTLDKLENADYKVYETIADDNLFVTKNQMDSLFFSIKVTFPTLRDLIDAINNDEFSHYTEIFKDQNLVELNNNLFDASFKLDADGFPQFPNDNEKEMAFNVYAGYYELFITDKEVSQPPFNRYFQGTFKTFSELECALDYKLPTACAIFVDKDIEEEYVNFIDSPSGTFEIVDGAITNVTEFVEEEE